MKKLFLETYGCQMNVADSEVVAAIMDTAGYEVTQVEDEADAVFVNTCSIRDNAEQKIHGRLHNPAGCGCCSATKSCLTLCNPVDCSTPGSPGPHCLQEFSQIHVP